MTAGYWGVGHRSWLQGQGMKLARLSEDTGEGAHYTLEKGSRFRWKQKHPSLGLETVLYPLRRIPFPVAFQKLFINPSRNSSSPSSPPTPVHTQCTTSSLFVCGGVWEWVKDTLVTVNCSAWPSGPCAWFSSLSSTEFEFAFYFWGLQLWFVPTARGAPGMHHCSVATFGKQWFEWPLLRSAGSLARFLPPYITGSSCIGSGSWPGHYISTAWKHTDPDEQSPCEREEDSNPGKSDRSSGPPVEGFSRGRLGSLRGTVRVLVPTLTAAELRLSTSLKWSFE